jgi:hypothetical protein
MATAYDASGPGFIERARTEWILLPSLFSGAARGSVIARVVGRLPTLGRWTRLATTHRHARALTTMAAIALVVALGCEREDPIIYRVPESVGVLAARDVSQPGVLVLEFEDGRRLTLERNRLDYLLGGIPNAGELVLAGGHDDRVWAAGIARTRTQGLPPDCFDFFSAGVDEGDTIALDVGLRLPKAPIFDDSLSDGGRYYGDFCLNSEGQITRYRGGRM